jgi:arylsulfatase
MNRINQSLLSLLAIAIFSCLPGLAVAQAKPNIILVFMDNFGWGEPGFNGGGIIRGAATPRMDKLADEGLRRKGVYNILCKAISDLKL